jgi:hypothetical protein
LIKLLHPIMTNEDLIRLKDLNLEGFRAGTVRIGFPAKGEGVGLETALQRICEESEAAVREGYQLIVLSDRDLPEGTAPIPSLLAVSAVNQHLVSLGVRTSAGLIVETGEAREVMHVALLLGYGATAVNPYLAFEIVAAMATQKSLGRELGTAVSIENYIKALCKGLLKIMSKMGISTLRSYRSAQVFEAVGLNTKVVDRYFRGTDSRVEGIGLEEIAKEAVDRYLSATDPAPDVPRILPSGGHLMCAWTVSGISGRRKPFIIFSGRFGKTMPLSMPDMPKPSTTSRKNSPPCAACSPFGKPIQFPLKKWSRFLKSSNASLRAP